jgi:tetratricopeptide (TPR) repeat protein
MNIILNTAFPRWLLVSLILIIGIHPLSTFADGKQAYLLDPATHDVLSESRMAMDNGKNAVALEKLKRLVSSNKLKDYDAAVVYQTMAFAENNLGNFTTAVEYFIKALALNALPDDVTHNLNYSIAQLLIHIERPEEGIKYLSKWFAKEIKVKPEAHILAATAYYYLKDYKQLIAQVEKALALTDTPPLNWYELLLAGYYETKEYNKASILLEKIISQHPDKSSYWIQLAGIYERLKQDKKALAIYELAYTKGILQKDAILQLINNYLYLEMPYKAAVILEKEMAVGDINPNLKMLTLLADSWFLAHENEKAESVFKEIIDKYNDDKARLRLGQLYFEAEQWAKSTEVLDVKFQSADSTLVSKANLLLGIAQYHLKNMDKATRAFTQALTDKSTNEQANWWLEYLRKKALESQKS